MVALDARRVAELLVEPLGGHADRTAHVVGRRIGDGIRKVDTGLDSRLTRSISATALAIAGISPSTASTMTISEVSREGCHAGLLTAGQTATNAFIEAFNGRFRAERLNTHWFMTLADAREKLEDSRKYYNEDRPHGAIGNKPPASLMTPAGASSTAEVGKL